MIIAVDFDGTVVTHEYPRIGNDIGAVPVLKKMIEEEQDCPQHNEEQAGTYKCNKMV